MTGWARHSCSLAQLMRGLERQWAWVTTAVGVGVGDKMGNVRCVRSRSGDVRRLTFAVAVTALLVLTSGHAAPLNPQVTGPFTGTTAFEFGVGGCGFVFQVFDGTSGEVETLSTEPCPAT